MPDKLILFPFGGNAREALISVLAINKVKRTWDVVGFIDDDRRSWGKKCCGVSVLGDRRILKKFPTAHILAVPGNPDAYLRRPAIIEGIAALNGNFARIVHPSVTVAPDAEIGKNVVLMSNVFVSCGVVIEDHCVVLPNTVIGHDSFVGAYSCVGSNVTVSGKVTVGHTCYIGSGSSIRNGMTIGDRSLIGLGSNVVTDVGPGLVVAGNPARTLRKVGRG